MTPAGMEIVCYIAFICLIFLRGVKNRPYEAYFGNCGTIDSRHSCRQGGNED